MIVHTMYDGLQVTIPETAYTLDGFREWAGSDDFPERGKISYFHEDIFVDVSREPIESHNQVKTEIGCVLANLTVELDLGKYYPDGLWITNDEAELSTEPDGTFISWETLESSKVRIVPSQEDPRDGLEMRGCPDWVLEVVSNSSVAKDTDTLPKSYHQAGIREYWLIDARGDDQQFTIFQHQPDGYVTAAQDGGWLQSKVFDRQFRLERVRDRVGGWQYTLHVRESV